MPASMSRRSRFMLSSSWAISHARFGSSVSRHSMPSDMSAEPSCRVEAGTQAETEVERVRPRGLAGARGAEQRRYARCMRPGAHPAQPLGHKDAVVGVRVSRRPPRCRAPRGQAGLCSGGWVVWRIHRAGAVPRAGPAARRTLPAHAGQVLARNSQPGWFRVDDDRRIRQLRAGEVVVGHHHVDAERIGRRHAVDRRNAVVDGDDDVRPLPGGQRHDLGVSQQPYSKRFGTMKSTRAPSMRRPGRPPHRPWRRRSRSRPRSAASRLAAMASARYSAAWPMPFIVVGGVNSRQFGGELGRMQHPARRQDAGQRGMQARLGQHIGVRVRNKSGWRSGSWLFVQKNGRKAESARIEATTARSESRARQSPRAPMPRQNLRRSARRTVNSA